MTAASPALSPALLALQARIGYTFQDPSLLRMALTHRSHSASHNERLEYLGDSVLNLAVSALLYRELQSFDEGDLSRVRSNLVRQQALHDLAQTLVLHQALSLGEGEQRSGGQRRPSILADALEALVGAIFVDGGFAPAQAFVEGLYGPILKQVNVSTLGKDAKTLLQELLQGRGLPLPTYEVVATQGAAHSQTFEVECRVARMNIAVLGKGASRRAAEQQAASKALELAQASAPPPPPSKVRRTRKPVGEPRPQARLAFGRETPDPSAGGSGHEH